MLSISNVTARMAGSYYQKDDYYLRDQSQNDRWQGKLCKRLTLEDGQAIETEQFKNLLTSNPKRAGYDLTFSSPKSVSVAASLDDEVRRDMLDCHTAAVTKVLRQIEHDEIAARVTTDGVTERVVTGNMVCARFQHYVSRNSDPQLHDHCVILNRTEHNGKLYAISNESLYENKILYGQLYRNELARGLQAKGYAVELTDPEKGFFELAGVEQETLKAFSTRRQEILEKLKQWQASDAASASKATLSTRKAKEHRDLNELRRSWRETAAEIGGVNVEKSAQPISRDQAAEQAAALDRAVERLAEKQFAFSERELERATLAEGCTTGMTREDFRRVVSKSGIIRLGNAKDGGDMFYYTTKVNQAVETEIERITAKSQKRMIPASQSQLTEMLSDLQKRGMNLSVEQLQAIRHIAGHRDQFIAVQGLAGTGKTYMLNAARQVWERQGFQVRGAAYTGKAAEGLQTDAGIKSATIHSLLNRLEKEAGNADPDEALSAKKTWDFDGLKPGKCREIWVIDEAGMIDNNLILPLQKAAVARKAQVVFVGDYQQLEPVGAGNAYSNLVQSGKISTCYLSDIRRQQNQQLLAAVKEAVKGDINKSLELVADSTQEIASQAKRFRAITDEYTGLSAADQANTIVLTAKNKDRILLNESIRAKLVKSGQLAQGTEFSVQSGQETASRCFAPGDKILFGKNDYRLGVKNGQAARITAINDSKITVETAGKKLVFDAGKYKHFDHGYAMTVYKAQGLTADRAIINLDSSQKLLNSRNSYYVDISRARHKVSIYTDSKSKLSGQVSAFAHKVTSGDFTKAAAPSRIGRLAVGVARLKLPNLPSIKLPVPILNTVVQLATAPARAVIKIAEIATGGMDSTPQQSTMRRGMRR